MADLDVVVPMTVGFSFIGCVLLLYFHQNLRDLCLPLCFPNRRNGAFDAQPVPPAEYVRSSSSAANDGTVPLVRSSMAQSSDPQRIPEEDERLSLSPADSGYVRPVVVSESGVAMKPKIGHESWLCNSCGFGNKSDNCVKCGKWTAATKYPALRCSGCSFGPSKENCIKCGRWCGQVKFPAYLCVECGFGNKGDNCVKCGRWAAH